jgi:hypothetical protein
LWKVSDLRWFWIYIYRQGSSVRVCITGLLWQPSDSNHTAKNPQPHDLIKTVWSNQTAEIFPCFFFVWQRLGFPPWVGPCTFILICTPSFDIRTPPLLSFFIYCFLIFFNFFPSWFHLCDLFNLIKNSKKTKKHDLKFYSLHITNRVF